MPNTQTEPDADWMNPEVYYTDDVFMVRKLLEDNWSYEESRPRFYHDQNQLARENNPGSIYVYTLGKNIQKVGINYDGQKWTHRICIDVQNPVNRKRHYDWMNEVHRICSEYRRAGRGQLGGWDYLELSNETFKHNYTSYYHDTIEISLVREVKPFKHSGFGKGLDTWCGKRCELE
jgi:hypothetical protein